MGRSGGGRVGGGGHRSVSHHSSGPRHSSYHHHSPHRHYSPGPHRHYHSWGWGGGGWRVRGNPCVLCAIPLFFILLIVCVIVILVVGSSNGLDTTLTRGEQAIVCPDSIGDDKGFKFTTSSSYATAYQFDHVPSVSSSCTTELGVSSKNVYYGNYIYNSFNLVKGSVVHFGFDTDSTVLYYIIKGTDEFNDFKNGNDFYYQDYYSVSYSIDNYFTAPSSDEYYFVVYAHYYSAYISGHSYSVNHNAYTLTGYKDKSSSDYTFDADEDDPGCIIVDMPCTVPDSARAKITVDYAADHTGLFWACVVLAAIFGFGGLVSIGICVFCVLKKRKGQEGTTYQNVVADPTVPTAYPAGYQQPQVPAAYSTVDPAYPTAGAPPAATYVDPAATAGYAPSYGSVQPTY